MTKPRNENNLTALAEQSKPKVSVCVITYNHKQYIAQALDSILAQKTSFYFEIVIGEDRSTDDTLAICKEYQAKYPNIIRVLDTPKNLGVVPNFVRTANACKGKYIAVLEGDDYWIDAFKLQKQVDILDQDAERALCFTGRKEYDEATDHYKIYNESSPDNRFYLTDFAKDTFFHLSTVLFRKPETPQYFNRFLHFNGLYDRPLYISLLAESQGYVYKLQDICSIYRLNSTSTFVPIGAMKRTIMVADMYAKIKDMHPELSLYMNYHLNKFDYFIMRDAYRQNNKMEIKRLANQIRERPTISAGWWLKCKTLLHFFF